jgi:plastocyanin
MTSRSIRWSTGILVLLFALALSACGGSSGTSATTGSNASQGSSKDTIVIKDFMFHPASLTVAPGATVTVRNEDGVTHTLTDKSDPKLFSTGGVPAHGTKTIKAPGRAGSYTYICMIHQYMTGTLKVS